MNKVLDLPCRPLLSSFAGVFFSALVCGGVFPLSAAETPPGAGNGKAAKGKSVAELTAQLAATDFDAREAARRKLAARGEAARSVLEKAYRESDDPEVRAAVRGLLRLLNRPTVEFFFRDRQGRPLPRREVGVTAIPETAGVRVSTKAAGNALKKLKTDRDGRVRIRTAGAGVFLTSWEAPPDFPAAGAATTERVRLSRGVTPLLAVVEGGGTVSGKLEDVEGKPFGSVNVFLARLDFRPTGSPRIFLGQRLLPSQLTGSTDGEGHWSVANVPPGVYAVSYQPPPLALAGLQVRGLREYGGTVRVREGGKVAVGTFRLRTRRPSEEEPGSISLKPTGFPAPKGKGRKTAFSYLLVPEAGKGKEQPGNFLGNRVAWRGFGGNRMLMPDDKGLVTLEGVPPGRYRLTLFHPGRAPLLVSGVKVEADKKTVLGERKFTAGGGIEGTTKAGGRHSFARVFALPERMFAANYLPANPFGISSFSWQTQRWNPGASATVFGNRKFRLRNLPPRRYVVCFSVQNARPVLVFGVEVKKDGHTTRLPTVVKLPAPVRSFGNRRNAYVPIRGKVLFPDDKPAGGATVQAWISQGVGQTVTFTPNPAGTGRRKSRYHKGDFSLTVYNRRHQAKKTGVWVRASLDDYAPVVRRLSPEELGKPVVLKLGARKKYGAVRVTVMDEQGAPLPGVEVVPLRGPAAERAAERATNRPYNRSVKKPFLAAPQKTGRAGQTVFGGLARGVRLFTLRDHGPRGWWLPEPVAVSITSGETAELKLAPRPGLVLNGQVTLPPDYSASPVLVRLIPKQSDKSTSPAGGFEGNLLMAVSSYHRGRGKPPAARLVRADKKGRFRFSGVPAGAYILRAEAPGVISAGEATVRLSLGKEAPKTIRLALKRPAKIVLRLFEDKIVTAASRKKKALNKPWYWGVDLLPAGTGKEWAVSSPFAGINQYRYRSASPTVVPLIHSAADGSGVVEFEDVLPGKYDVVISRIRRRVSPYGVWSKRVAITAEARFFFTGVSLAATERKSGAPKAPTAAELKQPVLPALPALGETGNVTGRIKLRNVPPVGRIGNRLLLLSVVGERAAATAQASFMLLPGAPECRAPVIVGTPPKGLGFNACGSFLLRGLPPGRYRLFLWSPSFGEQAPSVALLRRREKGTADKGKSSPGKEDAESTNEARGSFPVEVKAGETTDMGEVWWSPPKKQPAAAGGSAPAKPARETQPPAWWFFPGDKQVLQ